MEETIVIAGSEVPKANWDRTPTSIQKVVGHLEQRLAERDRCTDRIAIASSRIPTTALPGDRPPGLTETQPRAIRKLA